MLPGTTGNFPGPATAYERIEHPALGEAYTSLSSAGSHYRKKNSQENEGYLRKENSQETYHYGEPETEPRKEAFQQLNSTPGWTFMVSHYGIRLWQHQNGFWMREDAAIQRAKNPEGAEPSKNTSDSHFQSRLL